MFVSPPGANPRMIGAEFREGVSGGSSRGKNSHARSLTRIEKRDSADFIINAHKMDEHSRPERSQRLFRRLIVLAWRRRFNWTIYRLLRGIYRAVTCARARARSFSSCRAYVTECSDFPCDDVIRNNLAFVASSVILIALVIVLIVRAIRTSTERLWLFTRFVQRVNKDVFLSPRDF